MPKRRPTKDDLDLHFRPKCYPVVVPTEREQRMFEGFAQSQKHPSVGAWLYNLAGIFISFYFERPLLPDELAKWIEEADACKPTERATKV